MSNEEVDLYLRMSLDRTGLEAGIDRQDSTTRELCDRMGWTIRHVFADNSVSATKAKRRPDFERMLATKPHRRIVMWSVDRLVRKGADLERLIKLDVPVHSVMAGPMDLSTASGRLNARLLTSVATFEGEIKAERQMAAAAQRAESGKGWWPTRPFGFELDGTHRASEADALREAYRNVLAGGSIVSVEKDWAECGFVTERAGKPWRATSIRPVLLNARNAGIRVYNGKEIGPAAWQPIVTEESYRALVRLVNAPGRSGSGGGGGKGRRMNLLTGIAECAVCGAGVRAARRTSKSGVGSYRIYTCGEGQHVTQRADWLDGIVRDAVFSRLSIGGAYATLAATPDETEDAAALREELAGLHLKRDGILDDYADGTITRDERMRMLARVKGRTVDIEKRLAGIGLTGALADLLDVDDLPHQWDNVYDVHRKHTIVAALFDRIVLQRRGKGANTPKLSDVQIWQAGADAPLTLSA